jgi:hypothetical protein
MFVLALAGSLIVAVGYIMLAEFIMARAHARATKRTCRVPGREHAH